MDDVSKLTDGCAADYTGAVVRTPRADGADVSSETDGARQRRLLVRWDRRRFFVPRFLPGEPHQEGFPP